MAGSGAPVRTLRRGPAPIASFDHDVSDESSPETKQAFRLPEIREDPVVSSSLAPPEQRTRSHSTPAVAAGLHTPAAPRIDISRASSSSHHDSRDSSPELALFAGGGDDARGRLELGFREDGALDLRSSTEELAFLEPAPGEPRAAAAPGPPASRRHSRKDSQGSEAALLAVSGRTSRLSSVGSQCSAHSALSGFSHTSRVSRLSVASGVSRSPSPHKMLLETSFCGPKPIETDPDICAAAVEERLLEIAKLTATSPQGAAAPPVDARDRREVRTEVTVECDAPRVPAPAAVPALAPAPPLISATPVSAHAALALAPPPSLSDPPPAPPPDDDKRLKENQNRARAQERRARPRVRREPSEPEVYKSGNRMKDIIRIKLKPDDEYEEEEESPVDASQPVVTSDTEEGTRRASPELSSQVSRAVRPTDLGARGEAAASPLFKRRAARESRTPSPPGPPVSRKSSFCSLFKSRETIVSPDSPSDALRRKRSLTEGRSRSKSRDRSATPSSAGKIRGSVLSLFRTPRRSAASPSPSSREGSPVVQPQRQIVAPPPPACERVRRGEKLKYYEDTKNGIIHIPLRTPPDERPGSSGAGRETDLERTAAEVTLHRERPRPASAPQTRPAPISEPTFVRSPASSRESEPTATQKPIHRTVLPDGSIIIPLRSPTEHTVDDQLQSPSIAEAEAPSVIENIKRTVRSTECGEDLPPSIVGDIGWTVQSTGSGEILPPTVVGNDEWIFQSTTSVTRSPSATGEVTADASAPARESAADAPDYGPAEPAPTSDETYHRRKERIVFTTHVGSREQVFSTQFSITKTPSVTSEISGSFPSFADGEEARGAGGADGSSESEGSSESGAARGGSEVERRGLVVQESFEEELPYVPTTLPLERSLALPMVPVRERGGVRVAGVQRPRAAAPAPPLPRAPRPRAPPPPAPTRSPPPAPGGLRIRLPRRDARAPRLERARTRSGSEGGEARPKADWIDFEEVPERRKQPKRIQTLPAGAAGTAGAADAAEAGGAGSAVVFSYVEPEQCRCECHAHARDDETPLLQEQLHPLASPPPGGGAPGGEAPGGEAPAAPRRAVSTQLHPP